MNKIIRILHLEDDVADMELVQATLESAGIVYQINCVQTREEFSEAVSKGGYDVILADYGLPMYDGMSALHLVKELQLDVPFIFVSGTMGEDAAIEGLTQGATDYVLKQKLSRLAPALKRVLLEAENKRERKQAVEALKESENKYRLLADNVHDVIFVLDMNLKYTYISPSVKIMRKYEPEEVLKQSSIEQTLTSSSVDLAMKTLSDVMELEKIKHQDITESRTLQLEMKRKDGTTVWTEVKFSFIRDENQRPVGILGITRDISERKQAEESLKKSEEQYRLLADNITEHVWLMDLNTKRTIYVSPSVEKMYGYTSDEIIKLSFKKFLTAESLQKILDLLSTEMPKALANSLYNPKYSLELEAFHKDGHLLWIENTLSIIRDENSKPALILGETRDITERKRAEERLKETLDRLRKAMETTIQVLVSAIESRDAYTAGHQSRSADLACAIATEMELAQEKIEGIRMAGIIHDIGKLSIPAEILSKPTKLSEIEFSLIKVHSQSGYEMLKDVESPWPLAEIVYQHHERMNGSGYPRNLKGDEILLESRILTVADVVEAMASHRPYRAALGINAALEEIEKNKGILYDNAVADACLKLFREKGYQFT